MMEDRRGIIMERNRAWKIDPKLGIASKSIWRIFSA